jgi:hypothetical protein
VNVVYKCPNGHINSFRVTEHSPDINCLLFKENLCEECNFEFNDSTWEFIDYEYDDPLIEEEY